MYGKQLITPITVATVAIAVWVCQCQTIPVDGGSRQERLLRSTRLLKFQPDKFQGRRKRSRYFEGWYYKFVAPLGRGYNRTATTMEDPPPTSMAVVPGIFYGDKIGGNESHAFVFVTLDGERQHYYRFGTDEFAYASGSEEYYIQVGDNRFSHTGVSLNLYPRDGDDAGLALTGELSFTDPKPWPISLTQLGAMGPVGWLPGLECTHGVLSFDHILHGSLAMTHTGGGNEEREVFLPLDGGRGYTEKDFGRSFPSLWVWIQSNSFSNHPGTSLFVSAARLPLFNMELPGFTAAVWHNGTLIPFATWSGARFEDMRISKEEVYIAMRSSRRRRQKNQFRVEITVDRRGVPEALLYAPVKTRMTPFVLEALQARVHMRLFDGQGQVLVDDVGEHTGLEVHGKVQWLVDNLCGKKTASGILCL